MPNGPESVSSGAVERGLASRINRQPGHTVKGSTSRAISAMKAHGMAVPSRASVRKFGTNPGRRPRGLKTSRRKAA